MSCSAGSKGEPLIWTSRSSGDTGGLLVQALVLIGTLGFVPFLVWLAHITWPEKKILGKDPNTAFACYFFGVLFSWIGCAILR